MDPMKIYLQTIFEDEVEYSMNELEEGEEQEATGEYEDEDEDDDLDEDEDDDLDEDEDNNDESHPYSDTNIDIFSFQSWMSGKWTTDKGYDRWDTPFFNLTYPYPNRECSICHKKQGVAHLGCCKQCKVVYYCGRECQRKDWKQHRQLCLRIAGTLTQVQLEEAMLHDVDGVFFFEDRFIRTRFWRYPEASRYNDLLRSLMSDYLFCDTEDAAKAAAQLCFKLIFHSVRDTRNTRSCWGGDRSVWTHLHFWCPDKAPNLAMHVADIIIKHDLMQVLEQLEGYYEFLLWLKRKLNTHPTLHLLCGLESFRRDVYSFLIGDNLRHVRSIRSSREMDTAICKRMVELENRNKFTWKILVYPNLALSMDRGFGPHFEVIILAAAFSRLLRHKGAFYDLIHDYLKNPQSFSA
eukprot:gene37888-46025_t